jgi:hypothetical protein
MEGLEQTDTLCERGSKRREVVVSLVNVTFNPHPIQVDLAPISRSQEKGWIERGKGKEKQEGKDSLPIHHQQ